MEVNGILSDQDIVYNLQSGTRMEDTVKSLYGSCFGMLSAYIVRNSGTETDAEDIFQDVLVSFIQLVQADRFRGESSIKTFLFSMNRHAWLNELKKRGRAARREEKFEAAQERVEADTATLMAEQEGKSAVVKLVGKLGDACREILLMYYFENLSMKEITAKTRYESEQVVRNKKYKCLKQLSQMIAENPAYAEILKNVMHG